MSDPALDGAPCPCLPDQICCALTARCAPAGECPQPPDAGDDADATDAAPPRLDRGAAPATLTVEPAEGPVEGGFSLSVTTARPLDIYAIRLGGRACVDVEPAGPGRARCVAPAGDPAASRVDVVVEGVGPDGLTEIAVAPLGFHALLPPLTQIDAPFLTAVRGRSIVPLGDDLLLGGPVLLRRTGPLRYEAGQPGWLALLGEATRFQAGDVDGDGAIDLFVPRAPGDARGGLGSVLFGTGDGFGRAVELPRARSLDAGFEAVLADLDGDGDLDLFGAQSGAGAPESAFTLLWNEDGGWRAEAIGPPEQALIADLEVADVDRDGRLDVFACGRRPWLFHNTPEGFIDVSEAMGLRDLTGGCGDLELADLDLDGQLDLILVAEWGEQRQESRFLITGITPYYGRADGGFELRGANPDDYLDGCLNPRLPNGAGGAGQGSLILVDGDLDGDLDLFAPYSMSLCPTQMAYYENLADQGAARYRGRGMGQGHQIEPTGGYVADLDGDGDPDLISHGGARDAPPRLLRGNARDNRGATWGDARWLAISPTHGGVIRPGTWIEIDLDGPEPPDYAPGPGRLRIATWTNSAHDGSPATERIFGLGAAQLPVFVRVHYPGGEVIEARIDAADQRVIIDPAPRE